MDTRQFHKRLYDAARRLMGSGGGVVCAVSGGADSMAMLHGLHAVNRMRRCGWRLRVAHLDHNLPHDATAMMEFVRQAAASLDLPCDTERVDVVARSRSTGESIEEAGRKVRYAFLEHVATENGAAVVAVAHHADDQAETVLHRIVRGTGLRGLAGMPERRPIRAGSDIAIVRPLLTLRRQDCESYLRRRGLRFMHDATNDDIHAATRNRIRQEVLPLIERTINPDVATALVRLAEQAGRAAGVLRQIANEALAGILLDSEAGSVCVDPGLFAELPRSVQTEIVVLLLERLGAGLGDVGFERIEAAADAAAGDGRLRRIELPGDVLVERRGARLRFFLCERSETAASTTVRTGKESRQ